MGCLFSSNSVDIVGYISRISASWCVVRHGEFGFVAMCGNMFVIRSDLRAACWRLLHHSVDFWIEPRTEDDGAGRRRRYSALRNGNSILTRRWQAHLFTQHSRCSLSAARFS